LRDRKKRDGGEAERDAASMATEGKAAEYLAQAHKTLKKTSFFSFGSNSQKYDDASDLFEKAGNQFKIAKKCACALAGVPRRDARA
jgi:hypothetical protein